jgi:hypothetical protein
MYYLGKKFRDWPGLVSHFQTDNLAYQKLNFQNDRFLGAVLRPIKSKSFDIWSMQQTNQFRD